MPGGKGARASVRRSSSLPMRGPGSTALPVAGAEPLSGPQTGEPEDPAGRQGTRGRRKGRWLSRGSLLSWALYFLFIAGALALAPRVLAWALDTTHPLAAVSGSSMWPTLKKGDLVVLKGVGDVEDLEVGDIISFQHEKGLAIHRIVSIDGETIVTKGDGNPRPDQPIHIDQVVGKIPSLGGHLLKVPHLGRLSALLGPLLGPATKLFGNDTDGDIGFMEGRGTPVEEAERPFGAGGFQKNFSGQGFVGEGEVIGVARELERRGDAASSGRGGTSLGPVPDLSKEEDGSSGESPPSSVPGEDLR